MSTPSADDIPTIPPLATLIPRLLLGLLVLGGSVAAAAWFLREPIATFSTWLTTTTGWPGLVVSMALTDVVPFATHGAVLLVAQAGGLGFWTSFFAASVGTVLGVISSWSIGRAFGRSERLQYLLHRSRIAPFLGRYGIAAVALASITPIPDSLCVMGTGAAGTPLWYPLVGASIRIPKILVYLWVIREGWEMGA